ncbi:uncharacterized protein LOC120272437 [Dioscorea cayenensis subsp. rotundata]|uniref:Uncharacterized protein LOC120272437 n=1 Tax=Dioscorea cayennensis subsp. rotundata TaxID=55577 RepID=A0AB40C6F2_DIOCR|nr:uncharacterized protein LOC120272437 [Dioscorea cayenensis subsp. rotundata]
MNCEEMIPYIGIFNEMVRRNNPRVTDKELEKTRETTFTSWFKRYVEENCSEIDRRITQLAHGPSRLVKCYKGYFVNGFKFHTKEYSGHRSTLNCGVCVNGNCYNDYNHDFYGVLLEVIELEYFGEKKTAFVTKFITVLIPHQVLTAGIGGLCSKPRQEKKKKKKKRAAEKTQGGRGGDDDDERHDDDDDDDDLDDTMMMTGS